MNKKERAIQLNGQLDTIEVLLEETQQYQQVIHNAKKRHYEERECHSEEWHKRAQRVRADEMSADGLCSALAIAWNEAERLRASVVKALIAEK